MNKPELYNQANKLQRRTAKELMNEFAGMIQLRPDGKDSLIDVGCGPGDVLMDFIVPILPDSFSKVVGVDISPSMVEYARRMYGDSKNVDFKVLDIETDRMPAEFYEQFDHVTSFYCLHWPKNQRQALENIFNMLREKGDCLLVFPASCMVFDVYEEVARNPKWSEYMKSMKTVPPTQHSPDPDLEYKKLFEEVAFSHFNVEIRDISVSYEGRKAFTDHLTVINPFIDLMPENLRSEHIEDIRRCWHEVGSCEKMEDKEDFRYIMPLSIVVAFARR